MPSTLTTPRHATSTAPASDGAPVARSSTPHMPKVISAAIPLPAEHADPVLWPPHLHGPRVTDMFAGGGGSGLGALYAGCQVTYSFNHWPAAGYAHQSIAHTGADDAGVYIADLSDPSRFADTFATTEVLWASPSCPPWSNARRGDGTARTSMRTQAQATEEMQRARAQMWSPITWAEAHPDIKLVVVENVVDLITRNDGATHPGWRMLPAWLAAWAALGFSHTQVVCTNSMFHGDTPQSRDRLFFVFSKTELRDLKPVRDTHCGTCGHTTQAIQVGKSHPLFPGAVIGKYGRGWKFACSTCTQVVHPTTTGVGTVLDLDDYGTPVKDLTLGAATMRRIEHGLERIRAGRFAAQPMLIALSYTSEPDSKPGRPIDQPCPTLTARQEIGLATHPSLVEAYRTNTAPARLPSLSQMRFRMLRIEAGRAPEVARIGGFPDTYRWPANSKRDRWRLVGNAVTPAVARDLLQAAWTDLA